MLKSQWVLTGSTCRRMTLLLSAPAYLTTTRSSEITCFTSTNVQILTLTTLLAALGTRVPYDYQVNPKFTCFTSTKVQILTLMRLPGLQEARGSRVRVRARLAQYSVYLLYQYKSAKTDT